MCVCNYCPELIFHDTHGKKHINFNKCFRAKGCTVLLQRLNDGSIGD